MSQPHVQVQRTDFAVPVEAASWQKIWLVVGIVGALGCVAGFVLQPEEFLRGYLIGFMLWLGLSLGCMALLMVQHLSGGLWGISIRRILEASSKGLPLMAVLFLPILFGRDKLYAWMTDPSLTEHNAWYLNTPGWIIRFALYFAIWIGMELVLNKRSAQQDEPLTASNFPRFQLFSGIGLLLYALSISFASVDWVMSLDPHWGSTIYGMIFMAGEGLSALAFCIIMLTVLTGYRPYREIIKPEQFRDLGKLMLAFVMLFAYFSFSQWLIIWAGNLPEEISFYLRDPPRVGSGNVRGIQDIAVEIKGRGAPAAADEIIPGAIRVAGERHPHDFNCGVGVVGIAQNQRGGAIGQHHAVRGRDEIDGG